MGEQLRRNKGTSRAVSIKSVMSIPGIVFHIFVLLILTKNL